MYKSKNICVIIPVHNEESQISKVVNSIPSYVDKIVVVDDCSDDNSVTVVEQIIKNDKRIILLKHENNKGCGGAISTGNIWASSKDFDIVVRMDGDGQMDPNELTTLLDPIIDDGVDFTKGNRFLSGNAYNNMPKIRFYGNAILSLITKIVSGYWHISDFQSGYVAFNKFVLKKINWENMYKGYGQPNDLLIMLNVENFKVRDVMIEPIYNVGEKSGISIINVMFSLSWLLLKRFFWRLKTKYIIRDFHPLVFFYFVGICFYILSVILFIRLGFIWYNTGVIPSINALASMFSFSSASIFLLFAMWFDLEANKNLQ